MEIKTFTVKNKEVTLFPATSPDRPLIVLNNFSGNGSTVYEQLRKQNAPDFNLLSIGHLNWDHDMVPWDCPPLFPGDTACTGGADDYLKILLEDILPKAQSEVDGTPSFTGIAGYSLGGLFALYAMYQCDAFSRSASMSGSLWYPDFTEYILSHEMKVTPERIYLSLGDREAKTRNKMLKPVQKNTEKIAAHYRKLGYDVTFELNPGAHTTDAALRSAKGIMSLLEA